VSAQRLFTESELSTIAALASPRARTSLWTETPLTTVMVVEFEAKATFQEAR
jgi:hypothetical protein